MKRCYVTFVEGEVYENIFESLEYSVKAFSEYPLIKYSAKDFEIKWEPENWPFGYVYMYKILSCLKALDHYDQVVWLDTDIVVTPNIERIWENEIDGYPLLPNHRFYNFENWPHTRFDIVSDDYEPRAKAKVGLDHRDFKNVYRQACIMLFDRKCRPFFHEVLGYFKDYDGAFSSSGDEMMINAIMWRDRQDRSLGNANMCTHHFSPYHIKKFIACGNEKEYRDLFDPEVISEDESNLIILSSGSEYAAWNRRKLIESDNLILIFHGSNDRDYNFDLVDLMIEKAGIRETIRKKFKRFPF